MIKIKSFFDIEKEEKWLNKQLQNGYRCKNISGLGIYTFEKTDKRYVMRLDYQDYLPKEKYEDYKGMYADFGWSCIKGSQRGLQYWQKEDDEKNELYSDRQSKSNYYKRVMNYTSSLTIVTLLISYMIYKDSSLFLMEWLWDMEGALFWKALIFETPFLLLSSCPALMTIFFGGSFYKAYRNYSKLQD
jgi:hypothetical protein